MPNPPPAKVVALAEKLRFGLGSLQRKLVPPQFALLDFVSGFWSAQIVFTLADLNIVDALQRGPRSAEDVAKELGLDADHLYRLLRAATNLDVVHEQSGRTFSLTPIGEALCQKEGESLRDFIIMMGTVGARFWARLGDSVRQGKNAIEIETGMKPFEWLVGDEQARRVFNRAMTAVSSVAADAFIAAYDLSGFSTIVDVGGGHGRLLSALLSRAQSAQGVLFDLAEVVEGAPPILEQFGVAARARIDAGSFFERVPEGGDLYVLKSIIHDWPDDEALKILSNVRRAAKQSSKLVLYESVVPGANAKHFSKFLDIEMVVMAGGRERTREEFARLFERAGFSLTRVIATASPISIVEGVPA